MTAQRRFWTRIGLGALVLGLVVVSLVGTKYPGPTRAQSPLPTNTFTPTPTDTPVAPTPTDTPVAPTPTDTPAAPTPTDTPAAPTPTDTPAPLDCSAAFPSSATLWPPNHRFVAIRVLGLPGGGADGVSVTIDAIFQDEPVHSRGSGRTSPDGHGLGTATARVRAERDARGNGRVYHIGFTAEDGGGETCSGEVVVGVPKSPIHGPVDDGPFYDSTFSLP